MICVIYLVGFVSFSSSSLSPPCAFHQVHVRIIANAGTTFENSVQAVLWPTTQPRRCASDPPPVRYPHQQVPRYDSTSVFNVQVLGSWYRGRTSTVRTPMKEKWVTPKYQGPGLWKFGDLQGPPASPKRGNKKVSGRRVRRVFDLNSREHFIKRRRPTT